MSSGIGMLIASSDRLELLSQLFDDVGVLFNQVGRFARIRRQIDQMIGFAKWFAFGRLPPAGAVAQDQFPFALTNGKHPTC